jgi:biotin carboxyl carrier protein
MNLRIKLNDRVFTVEVGDLAARPIVAVVEGERFEVWPAPPEAVSAPLATEATPKPPISARVPPPLVNAAPNAPSPNAGAMVLAPLPGVIVAIAARPGDTVTVGQALCAIEAMKMKNVVRANRAGTIKAVHVSVGQTVKQRHLLVEYE